MDKMKTVNLLGRTIQLEKLSKVQLKGITIGDSLSYAFYNGIVNGIPMLFVEPKKKADTPRSLAITSSRFDFLFQKAVVFILPSCPAFERQRLIDKKVFFIVSEKFAYLPNIMINERMKMQMPAQRFSPVAQYLLLYHLQIENIEGKSARELEQLIPYSYVSITLGISCLEELGILSRSTNDGKSKLLHFGSRGKQLWETAQAFLINPIDKKFYCDNLHTNRSYPVCGINALAHYTMLNPDPEKMFVLTKKQWNEIKTTKTLVNPNKFDGNIMVEIWKYPPVSPKQMQLEWVDRLSLAISLNEDQDPRVEGEVERLINETQWKD